MPNMGIEWKAGEEKFKTMEELFLRLTNRAIAMNHYDLWNEFRVEHPELDISDWRNFLMDTRVSDYIASEFDTIKLTELRKIIMDINNSRSVGQAQIVNSLIKILDEDEKKSDSGPAFVYCYVPLNDEQKQAENVIELDTDPFIVEG